MMWKIICFVLLIEFDLLLCMDPAIEEEELRAANFLVYLNQRQPELRTKIAVASWNHESNITEETLKTKLRVVEETAKEFKKIWEEVVKFRWQEFKNYDIKRQLMFYSYLSDAALPDNKYKKYLKIINDMLKVYSTTKLCDFKNKENCDLSLEPELTQILLNSRNPDELKYIWVEWRKAIGPKIRRLYKDYVIYKNEASRLNHFSDTGEAWLRSFEAKDIKEQVKILWEQIRPLYLQIHAYVRFKLREQYGDIVSEKGPIPAHLLGDMWAQTWRAVAKFSFPIPNKTFIDVTDEMIEQNYTPEKIFKLTEDFFVSLNLSAMPPSFWEKSILEKPTDGRQLVCQAQAWDFSDGQDFRIKQCTRITYESFKTAHHEMGHIQYSLQYKHQPFPYRRGANDAFHEAVGDVIALSVSTMKHLKKIDLLKSEQIDNDIILNNLYKMGLEKIVFLPFAYVMELWRWDVFSGNTSYEDYNCKWWKLRHEYQGIEPPVNRTEDDFDPAAKFHIIADVPYIKYFISYIIQFQFHRTLCEKAGQYIPHNPNKPLYECDIYQSLEAGNALKKILEMGASRPWQDAMESLTGQRFMHASALLEYFEPLRKWLEHENKKNNVHIGWEAPINSCVKETKEEH